MAYFWGIFFANMGAGGGQNCFSVLANTSKKCSEHLARLFADFSPLISKGSQEVSQKILPTFHSAQNKILSLLRLWELAGAVEILQFAERFLSFMGESLEAIAEALARAIAAIRIC